MKEKITKVCIDDFAFKKRHTYGTIMIDIDTHRIIDLLPSREIRDVAEWLSSFPNLEIVSRDGSVSYNSAVKQANADIIQISDRFHLLKGLTDAARTVITSLVEKVLKLTKQGWTRTRIAEETGISYTTVKRYQSPDFNPVHGKYNTIKDSKIKPYAEQIKRMLKERCTFRQIEEALKQEGYDGASSTIRMYTTRERKLLKEAKGDSGESMEKIERKWLISLLYKPVGKVKKISQEQLDKVIERYPLIGAVHGIVKTFKNTLFSRKPDELEKWMSEAERLGLEQINSFVKGLRRDIDAVKRAIELDYNNGLAEGSVNKLKVVKRIMYGRNSFELLKGKLLRLELRHRIN